MLHFVYYYEKVVQKLYDSLISVFSGGDSFLCLLPGIRPCVFCCRHGAVRSGKTTVGVPKVFRHAWRGVLFFNTAISTPT